MARSGEKSECRSARPERRTDSVPKVIKVKIRKVFSKREAKANNHVLKGAHDRSTEHRPYNSGCPQQNKLRVAITFSRIRVFDQFDPLISPAALPATNDKHFSPRRYVLAN